MVYVSFCELFSKITFVILNFIGWDGLTVFFLTAFTGGDATASSITGAAGMGAASFSSSFALFSRSLSNSLTTFSAFSDLGGSALALYFWN